MFSRSGLARCSRYLASSSSRTEPMEHPGVTTFLEPQRQERTAPEQDARRAFADRLALMAHSEAFAVELGKSIPDISEAQVATSVRVHAKHLQKLS